MGKMQRKWSFWSIAIIALIGIGIVYSIVRSPGSFFLPIIILGAIFLLYKYPPSFLKRYGRPAVGRTQVRQGRAPSSVKTRSKPRSKNAPFRVIEGGKDDNDMPKYH